MQGKPQKGINDKDFIEILKKCAKVKAASFGCTVEETTEWHDANRLERLVNRLATYDAALRELVAACTTGDTYADGRPAGVRTPEREVLERARKALEDNT